MDDNRMVVEYQYEDGDVGAYYVNELSLGERQIWQMVYNFYFRTNGKVVDKLPTAMRFRYETDEDQIMGNRFGP